MLIYAVVQTGNTSPQWSTHVAIFTEEGEDLYVKYLSAHPYPANYISTNSDNLWLPMPSSRRVHLSISSVFQGWLLAEHYVTGYR